MTTLIKVYDYSEEYQYENYFLVDITKEEKLLEVCEDIQRLDLRPREEKYGSESIIDCTENYIVNNLKKVDFERIDIDTY